MTTPQYELPEPSHWHAANGIAIGYTADQLRQEVAKAEQRGRERMRADAVKVLEDEDEDGIPLELLAQRIKELK